MAAKKDARYENVEDAYRKLSPELFNFARRNLIEQDNYMDVVSDAFIKVIQWANKNPNGHLSHKQIYRLTLRACRYRNRQQRMVSIHDPAYDAYFRSV